MLTPPTSPRPLLHLLGLTDQQQQEKMAKEHPYGFNMGHGRIIPFKDYKEAARALMERNMPEILHDRQKKAVFIPETYLPKMPHIVDLPEYEKKKDTSSVMTLAISGLKKGKEDAANARGDLVETELANALKNFYRRPTDTKLVILQGCVLRALNKGGGGIQENDFVIVDFERKVIICIEAKATLTGPTGHNAVNQAQELKGLLEDFFAIELASREWAFVGMIFTNNINIKRPLCPLCNQFVIKGHSELRAKLITIEDKLKLMGPRSSPSYAEYVSIVQGLSFVVLSQPMSTLCTIVGKVYNKVVGQRKGVKTKAGQGDFQSIIFWTNDQANTMLTRHRFVFFASPWSTGKTLLMREKAVLWAKENPSQKLFFTVIRCEFCQLTSLLEMELEFFFHQKHQLHNVEVLGITTGHDFKDALSSLLNEVTTRPPGSWMVDELIMPGKGKYDEEDVETVHEQWTNELVKIQSYVEAQAGILWITCAGIEGGQGHHFQHSHLATVIPPVFYLPKMDVPLRNTRKTLAMAGLETNTQVRLLSTELWSSTTTHPVYRIPDDLMSGVDGDEFLYNNVNDANELMNVVGEACEEVLRRTGGVGFPVLCDDYGSTISSVKNGVERAGASLLVYHRLSKDSCSELEVKDWLKRRAMGEEKRCLLVDPQASRGWEASHVLVVRMGAKCFENLVMRAIGYCAIVKHKGYKQHLNMY